MRFPYEFIDFDVLGPAAYIYLAGIFASVILLGHVFYFIDHRMRKREPDIQESMPVSKGVPVIAVTTLAVAAMLYIAVLLGTQYVSEIDNFNRISNHENVILKVGRYMHESGDPGKYITIFDDNTIQVSGFDYYDYVMNKTDFLEEQNELPESVREPRLNLVLEQNEWYRQRGYYGDEINQDGMFMFTIAINYYGEDSWYYRPIFEYINEDSIGWFDGTYIYYEP